MSKRIVSFILAVILLVGLVPAGAISASAASNRSVSSNAIKFIKDWEGYSKTAYPDGMEGGVQRYSYGYGTKAPNASAVITEAQADEALREELKEIDKKVNQFAAAHNRNFTQAQHDALVSFSYNVGWGWMSQLNYRITKAVINGSTGNAFLQAMTLWSNVDSIPNMGLVARRMAEADMYLNGSYSKNARKSYTYVKFDPNGGVLGEDKVQAYDYNTPVTITSVPTREGYTFLGWYASTKDDAAWIGVLNSTTAGKTLYARWQSADAVEGGKVVGTPASYTISGQNFASNKVYAVPNANNASIATINQNDTFKVTAEYIDNNKDKWLKINSGWVKLGEIKVTTSTSTAVTVTVTNDYINVRKEPNTDPTNAPIGTVHLNDKLTITAVKEVKGAMWGQFERGWVALMYTDYNTASEGGSTGGLGSVIATGTVLVTNTNLNIRTGAGIENGLVGSLTNNSKVDIYEITTVNGHGWGRIGSGKWVCLDYVNYKMNPTTETKVEITNGPATAGETYKFKATVNMDGLNIYEEPTNVLANPIGSLNKNDNVNILDIVSAGNGLDAMVFGKVVTKDTIGWIQLDSRYVTYTATGVVSNANDTKGTYIHASICGTNTQKMLSNGTSVTILEVGGYNDQIWGRVKEGWINLAYVKLNTTKPAISSAPIVNTTTTTTGKVIYTGIVNSGINLNVRLNAGVDYDVVNSLVNGTEVKVYDKVVVNGHYWGKLGENAWICLTYVTETTNNAGENGAATDGNTNTSTDSSTNTTAVAEMATVVDCTTGVNIRSTPSVSGALLGSAPLGSRVKVLETTVYNNSKWARTEDGWISMLYLKLDSEAGFGSNSTVNVNGLFRATVLVNKLDVYDALGTTGTVVASMLKGDSAYVTELQSQNGTNVSGKVTVNGKTGWIDLSSTTFIANGQVNTSGADLIVRPNYGDTSTEVKKLPNGSSISLMDIKASVNGSTTTLWGKITAGQWVNLDYVRLVATSASSNASTNGIALGKIAYEDVVNVRKAAGAFNELVTTLNRGTEVTIYEETVVNEAIWCRISTGSINGWVAKDYIEVTFTANTGNNNNTTPETNTTPQAPAQTSNYATGIVNSDIPLNVRQLPDINAAVVDELPKGMTVTIYETRKGGALDWGRIDNGWIAMSYVTVTSTGSTGAGNMGTIIKAFSTVNVRSDASANSAKVGDIMVGSRVEVLAQKFGTDGFTWYRINNGWVRGDYLELDAPFVDNSTNNGTNTDPSTPVTGPQDEVGGMATTAILKHHVNEVVEFYKYENNQMTANGTKLVNGETVIITALKGLGTDVWANTKDGWFNLSDDAYNFVAVAKVNTNTGNYLQVYSEAGKINTEPVDKVRDQAFITLTEIQVANGGLWGKTARGWVDMAGVELTATKEGTGNAQVNPGRDITSIYQLATNPIIKGAKAKSQHLSITVYNAINGYSVGIIRNDATFWIKEVKADGTNVWGSVQTSEGDYWVKLSDITYENISTYVAADCYATTSAGGSSAMGTAFKMGNPVTVTNLTAVGGTIYGQIVSDTNKSGWLSTSQMVAWTPILPKEVQQPASCIIVAYLTPGYTYVYDNANGTAVGTLQDASTDVRIQEVKAAGGIVWGKITTKLGTETKTRWVKMSDLTYTINAKVVENCSAMTEAGGSIAMTTAFKKGDNVSANKLTAKGDNIYVQITSENAKGGWLKNTQLSTWTALAEPGIITKTSASNVIFKGTCAAAPAMDAPGGNIKGYVKQSATVLVTDIAVGSNGKIYYKIPVTIVASDYSSSNADVWVEHFQVAGMNATATAVNNPNVRDNPSTAASSYGTLPTGTTVKVKGLSNPSNGTDISSMWAKIEYTKADNTVVDAYVNASLLTFATANY